MTLPGGPAAKLGYQYEKWWTLSELVRMLRGETDSLRIEPPGPGLDGVEFVVEAGGHWEYHQAKRSHRSGKWSLATLASSGVLATIGELLIDNRHRFVFVSGSDARELADLCEGAVGAESLEEFQARFLDAKERASSYDQALEKWQCDDRAAWDVFRRIDVHTISERQLETKVRWALPALFLGDVDKLCDRLAAIVDAAVYRTIKRDKLLGELGEAGFFLRKVSTPAAARQAVVEATDRYLTGVRRNLIQGSLIPRGETDEIIARLTGEQPGDCVLVGQAGSGKTGCVIEVVENLLAKGIQVLAFRLDRHMSATSTIDLGQRLALQESPALVLNAAAKLDDARAVLIIDQLDAVSAMSGRRSDAFDVAEQLLIEAKAASIGTMIVCRAFDWRNDPRLRSLIRDDDTEIKIDQLSPDDVQNVLAKTDRDTNALSTRQYELLRLPQNLSLFLNTNFVSSKTFASVGDLFGLYWDAKRKLVGERSEGKDDQWMDVMGAMCETMSETQQLAVRKEKLDQFSVGYLEQYVSENVLVKDGNRYAFGHESFFDYCFARLFVNKEESLVTLLKSGEQHLFRRAQVRQILAYLREMDCRRYVRELRSLISEDGIRTHIKDLVFAWLADVDDPRDPEWRIWTDFVPYLRDIDQDRKSLDRQAELAWKRLIHAESWFLKFTKQGVIDDWLNGSSSHMDRATSYLCLHQRNWPNEVAAYLEPFADQRGAWSRRLRDVMFYPGTCGSRSYFELFLRLLDNGTLDADGGHPFGERMERMYNRLRDQQLDWIPEILAHQIRRLRVLAAGPNGSEKRRWSDALSGAPIAAIQDAAKEAPGTFVGHILPAVLELADATSKEGQNPPVRDAVWETFMKASFTVEDACLHTLAGALVQLASSDEDIGGYIEMLSGKETFVANYLLLALYRGGGQRYADEGVLAFCDNPWRFDCGYLDSPYWCATETLKALTPHCRGTNLAKLESVVLAYVHPYERTKEGVRRRYWVAFNLLTAIPNELRSEHARRQYQELQRRFYKPAMAPRVSVGGVVESPIPSGVAARMPDEGWLRAIATQPFDQRIRWRKDGTARGGAWELAAMFGESVQSQPGRFAQLGLKFPRETNPVYFSELLRGLGRSAVDDDAKMVVCQKVFEYARVECGRDIADLLAKANAPLPEYALEILASLAKDVSSEDAERFSDDSGGGEFYDDGGIEANGFNSTRGRAALAIGELIFKDGDYISLFESTLNELVGVRNAAVGSCVAYTLRAVAYHDAALAIDLFLRMDFSEHQLFGTHHVREFIRENLHQGFGKLRNIVVRMLRSPHPHVGRAGAALGCMAALFFEDARILADESLRGPHHQRLGSADVAAANVWEPKYRQWCEAALKAYFVDDNAEVRKVATSCFHHIPEGALATYGGLIEAFFNSPAYEDDAFFLLEALKNAREPLPKLTWLACNRTLVGTGSRTMDTMTVTELAFRLYQQHPNDEWTKRCLDLIDHLCLEAPDEAGHALNDFER